MNCDTISELYPLEKGPTIDWKNRDKIRLRLLRLSLPTILLMVISVTEIAAQKKFNLQLYVNPTVSYRKLHSSPAYASLERPMPSYDLGILASANSKGKLKLSTGLVYSRKGYSWGDYPYSSEHEKMVEIFKFIEIPLRATIPLYRGDLYFVGGFANDILISRRMKIKEYPGDVTDLANLAPATKFNLSVIAGLGIYIHVRKEFTLSIEPNFKYQIKSHGAGLNRHLFTIGLSAITGVSQLIDTNEREKRNGVK